MMGSPGKHVFAIGVISLVIGSVCLSGFLFADEATSKPAVDPSARDASIDKPDRRHWSFQTVRRPEVPKVRGTDGHGNPIDHFVLSKLESRGWKPAPPARPSALLRRMYLDLLGIPPTLNEQDALLKDPSEEAFDQLVANLLNRPGYGERWAGIGWIWCVTRRPTGTNATRPSPTYGVIAIT